METLWRIPPCRLPILIEDNQESTLCGVSRLLPWDDEQQSLEMTSVRKRRWRKGQRGEYEREEVVNTGESEWRIPVRMSGENKREEVVDTSESEWRIPVRVLWDHVSSQEVRMEFYPVLYPFKVVRRCHFKPYDGKFMRVAAFGSWAPRRSGIGRASRCEKMIVDSANWQHFLDLCQNNATNANINYILLYKTSILLYLCTVNQNKHRHYDR